MTIYGSLFNNNCSKKCLNRYGCPEGVCADFEIKRHDTEPPFILSVTDCNGPLDMTDCIVEVSMWAKAKFKLPVANSDTSFAVADCIGFEQAQPGDLILVDANKRSPEQMLVTGFDEINKLFYVQRGYAGTSPGTYARGTKLLIFRILNAAGDANLVRQNIEKVDGTKEIGVLTDSQLLYHWRPSDTCLPGCYWMEFKLLKIRRSLVLPALIVDSMIIEVLGKSNQITNTLPTPTIPGCQMSGEVEWVRRFPASGDGYLINILESPTAENIGS